MQKSGSTADGADAVGAVRKKSRALREAAAAVPDTAPPQQEREPPLAASVGLLSQSGSAIDPRSLLFDADWYRSEYPDVAAAGTDPVRHFFDDGAREGRNPNRYFLTRWYLETYPDIASSQMNPFLHYLLYGAREGRRPKP